MADQFTPESWTAENASGAPVSGAKAYWYQKGTTTPLTVYTDEALSVAHANPQIADSNGVFAPVWIGAGVEAKVDVQDPDTDVSLPGYPRDAVPATTAASSAANIGVTPFSGVPSVNVQAALEDIQTNLTAEIAALPTGLEFIQTLDASNSASLDFDTLDTATYDAFLIILGGIVPATDAVNLLIQPSADGGSNHTAVGRYAYSGHNDSPAAVSGGSSFGALIAAPNVGSDTNEWGVSGDIMIASPGVTFTASTRLTYKDASGNMVHLNGSVGLTAATTANAVQIIFSSGNIESGTATLYGLRNA